MATTATTQPVPALRPLSFNFVERSLRRSDSSSHLRTPRVLPCRPNSSSACLSEMNSFGTMSLYLSEIIPASIGGTLSTPSTGGGDVYKTLSFEDGDEEISKRGRFLTGSLGRVRNKRPSRLNLFASTVVPEGEARVQEDDGKADGFPRRNRFVTRDGMRHHPYPEEAPYMQAYDPVLLEK